jgi:hypothetical protein
VVQGCDPMEQVDEGLVGRSCFGAEAREPAPHVGAVERHGGGDLPGEEALTERAPGNEADPELLARRQDFRFGISRPERVFALDGSHRLDGVRPSDRLCAGFGESEVFDFAFRDQVSHGAGHLLDRDARVDAMLIEQVDAVGPQTHERSLGHMPDVLWAAVEAPPLPGVRIDVEAELCCDHDPVTHRRKGFPDKLFVAERAVGLGGIEEGVSAVYGGPDDGDHLSRVAGLPVVHAHAHAAQAERRNLESGTPQHTRFHRFVPLCGYGRPLTTSGACAALTQARVRRRSRRR